MATRNAWAQKEEHPEGGSLANPKLRLVFSGGIYRFCDC